ncbi:MAG: Fic family protein [Nanoarchaeota archaeon]|nr:Fic family protein [Nanoarchaeota archaeon]
MYIEKRKSGKKVKYYLAHSYREGDKVEKIRKYLGSDLSKEKLKEKSKRAEKSIRDLIEEISTRVFSFSLTNKQVESLNRYNGKVEIVHLTEDEWKTFQENFVYNTNAIEGSTVPFEEVKEILENKKKPSDEDELEAKNVAKAVDFIKNTKENLSLNLILKLHRICFEGTKSFAGKLREVNVVIRDSSGNVIHAGVPKEELGDYLEDLIEWHDENKGKFRPLVLAAIMHNQFEYIHPFQDGNGRVGRLLLNFILLRNNYPPINILLQDRKKYYQTLLEYSKNDDLKTTLGFLVNQYKKTLRRVTTKKKR